MDAIDVIEAFFKAIGEVSGGIASALAQGLYAGFAFFSFFAIGIWAIETALK